MIVLFPTALEAARLLEGPVPASWRPVASRLGDRPVLAALCGFGPYAAGVLAAWALTEARPPLAILAGIAGTLDPERLHVGAVLDLSAVLALEVGRGEGATFVGARALGFPQAPAETDAIVDRIPLEAFGVLGDLPRGVATTVSAASASPEQAARRRALSAGALAEDMESFPVALAARLAGVPLRILRGISNVAGEPDRARWDLEAACAGLRGALRLATAAM